jgi:protein-S-isoprenylcysteine O-methyltransferase Ste14
MYAGAFVLLLAAPIALGSLAGLAAFPLLVAVIVVRMLDEERVLARDLEGYDAYRKKTRSRLVPGVF